MRRRGFMGPRLGSPQLVPASPWPPFFGCRAAIDPGSRTLALTHSPPPPTTTCAPPSCLQVVGSSTKALSFTKPLEDDTFSLSGSTQQAAAAAAAEVALEALQDE